MTSIPIAIVKYVSLRGSHPMTEVRTRLDILLYNKRLSNNPYTHASHGRRHTYGRCTKKDDNSSVHNGYHIPLYPYRSVRPERNRSVQKHVTILAIDWSFCFGQPDLRLSFSEVQLLWVSISPLSSSRFVVYVWDLRLDRGESMCRGLLEMPSAVQKRCL